MATLAKNEVRTYELGIEDFNDLPVIESDIIYEGAAVGDNGSGYFRPLVAGDPFGGFTVKKADNSNGANGDINVRVKECGKIVLDVTGVTGVADKDSVVYASDDNTFTLISSGNSAIGKIARWISGTKCVVAFEAVSIRSI